jgi:hypothetical protein
VAQVAQAFRPGVVAWRTGANPRPGLVAAARALPPPVVRAVEGVARGLEAVEETWLPVVAGRAWALVGCADQVEQMCADWSGARAETPGGPAAPEEPLREALRSPLPSTATALWHAGREGLLGVASGVVGEAGGAVTGVTGVDQADESARGFLVATADAWGDALAHAERRAGHGGEMPGALVHARVVEAPQLDEWTSPPRSRHLAREMTRGFLGRDTGLKLLRTRPIPWLPAVGVLGEDGVPRVGWAEEAGVRALAWLVAATWEACALAAGDVADGGASQVASRAGALALVGGGVLRRGLSLSRQDEEETGRHLAFWLLREARVAAALASLAPANTEEAREALHRATGRDPDLLEAAARVAPWPVPSLALGPLGPEHARRWLAWRRAGTACVRFREAWDADFCLREAAQRAVREAIPSGELEGGKPDQGEALAQWLLERLG